MNNSQSCFTSLTLRASRLKVLTTPQFGVTILLSSSVSLMAQGIEVTITAKSGILASPVSMTMLAFSYDFVVESQADSCRFYSEAELLKNRARPNLRRALWHHCEGGEPHLRVGRVFEILHAVFE